MAILESIFCRILEMAAIASVVGVITWGIQKLLRRKISPKWLIYLWLVFLLVLINPIPIESRFSIYNKIPIEFRAIEEQKEETLDQHTNLKGIDTFWTTLLGKNEGGVETVLNEARYQKRRTILKCYGINFYQVWKENKIQCLWYILILLYWSITLWNLCRWILNHLKMRYCAWEEFQDERLNGILEKAKNKLFISRKIQLINQQEISTPGIYGRRKPKILLDRNILTLTDEEIELIFLHELLHLKKEDIALNQFLLLLKSFYWFHPILNCTFCRIKKDIELANDENVLERIKSSQIPIYCKTLLKVSQFSNQPAEIVLGMSSHFKELEERIKMIKEKDKFLKNKTIIVTTILVLVLGITVCFATNRMNIEDDLTKEGLMEENLEKERILENTLKIVNPLTELNVTVMYGKRIHPITKQEILHDGIDFKAENGEKVMTIADGIVENTGYNSTNGNFIEVKHENPKTKEIFYSYYAHLSEIEVEIGDVLEAGMEIGKVGSTGRATGPHLHLKIMNAEKEIIDPSILIKE